ncbi:hypothetical protein QA646_26600 (plasmid) [Rhizobium sp. CB3090]|uniref:hypothetical protein n=1 Tax=Rhizobium sp. CB3090 TaxID=3039156 RepID=UPI0024B1BF74|nr:hypothetical protein [Rhizobium sp. CB3090]WFU11948.1 hypothetical protein QA646_26600 [Rhizobium sp. CB3090]
MKSGEEKSTKTDDRPGATATFPYDRMTVERFRKSFPRARWSDDLKAWFVPGKTASRRFDRWLEREAAAADAYADIKGRDAYAFDPILSKYLLVQDDRLEVRTPYSRTVVDEMREVPFASWDADNRVWSIPYRSYEDLRRRWGRIEAAARRNEPEERKRRQAERRGSEEERASRARAAERRRRRHPLRPDQLPPLDRPVMTRAYGIVVFTGFDGELVEPETLRSFYAGFPQNDDYIWGRWRPGTFDELVKTWPSRPSSQPDNDALWWQPTLAELRVARKSARALERRRTGTDSTAHLRNAAS